MKKLFSGLSLALVAGSLLLLSSPAVFSAPAKAPLANHGAVRVENAALDFHLVNQTGYTIAHLYISPSAQDDWGDNILEAELDSGDAVDVVFHPEADAIKWDMRADWAMEDGSEEQEYVYWKGLKLTEINKVTLKYDSKKDKTSAVIE